MSQDYIYTAGLDADPLYKELQRIDGAMQSLGKQGAAALNQVEQTAGRAGKAMAGMGGQASSMQQQFGKLGGILQQIGGNTDIGKLGMAIGVISGGVEALTAKLIQMAAQAVQAFNQIYNQSIQMNQEAETAQFLFQNLFGGDMDKAGALVVDLRKLAQALGVSSDAVFKFSQAIAPDSANVGELKQLITLADRFSDLEGRPFEQLVFSFNEMVAGDFVSAKDTLNINKQVIEKLKEAQKEYGNVKGLVVGLTEYLESRGLGASSLDAMAGSAQQAQKSIAGIKSELTAALGAAPFEAYKESMDFMGKFLNDNREALLEVAYATGDILASFSTLGNSFKEMFGGDVDVTVIAESFRATADAITEINLKMGALLEQVGMIGQSIGDDGWLGALLDASFVFDDALATSGQMLELWLQMTGGINEAGQATNALAAGNQRIADVLQGNIGILDALNSAMTTANQLTALIAAGWAGLIAGVKPFMDDMSLVGESMVALVNGDWERLREINDELAASQASRSNSLFDVKGATDAMNKSLLESATAMAEADKKTEEYYQKQKKRKSDTGALPDETALPAAGEAGKESEELIKAREKVNDKMTDIQVDFDRKMLDLQAEYEEKSLDMQQDFAEQREDIERKYQETVADINSKFEREIAEAEDFSDEERAIAQKHRQQMVDLDKQTARQRADIELSYQREIKAIQRQFEADAEDAARNQDAIAFVRAQEGRDRAIENARTNRDTQLSDAGTAASRQRADLLEQQQKEVEDSRAANAQKLEDLRSRLAQELQDAQLKYQRDIEAQGLAERRKTAEFEQQSDRRLAKEMQNNQRRLEDLQRTLAKEIELIRQADAAKAGAGGGSTTPWSQQSSTITNRKKLSGLDGISGRAFGGSVLGGIPVVVGERGAELFVPPVSGQIIPNHRLMASTPAAGAGGGIVYNQQRVDLSMLDPSQLSPAQRAAMRAEAMAILAEL